MQNERISNSPNDPDFNFLKEVWRFMMSKESVSQPELRDRICKLNGKSQTASYYIVQILCKPIQIGWELKGGVPTTKFVQEPMLVEVPSMEQSKSYALDKYWREFVDESSNVFEKAKRFYQ